MFAVLAVNAAFIARGEAATYVPPGGGAATPCRVYVDRAAEVAASDGSTPRRGQVAIDVRRSEIAAPANKGVFTLTASGETFTVNSIPKAQDSAGFVWTMMAVPPRPPP